MGRDKLPEGEKPHGPVEIIPPGEDARGNYGPIWIARGSSRVKIVKLGPVSGALFFILGLLIIAFLFALFTGAFLILFPIGFLLGAGAWLSGRLGGNPFRKLK
jgi:hypothetical protein